MQKSNVFQYLNDNEEALMDFLKDLIRVKSENGGIGVSGTKERDIAAFLQKYLTDAGFEVDMIPGHDADGERMNVVAVLPGRNRDKSKSIIFNSHIDTVPVTEVEKWDVDPFGGEEIEGRIYGRGANDMKGGLAASVFAAKAIAASTDYQPEGDVILMLSAGEESCEGGILGAKVCAEKGYKAPLAIVCEPSSLELHNASCSLLCFELIVQGKAIHICCRNQVLFPQPKNVVSGPQIGVDAVEKALPIMQYLYKLEKDWNHRWQGKSMVGTGGKPTFDRQGVGVFNINPSFIESGTYIGAVPGSIKVTYALWHPPEIDYHDILDEIREKIALLAKTDDWLSENPPVVNGPVSQLWRGFATDDNIEPVKAFKTSYRDAMGKDAIVTGMRCTCDGTYLEDQGIPSIVCGPGEFNDGAHGYNEFVRRQEVLDAAKIYASFIYDWCK